MDLGQPFGRVQVSRRNAGNAGNARRPSNVDGGPTNHGETKAAAGIVNAREPTIQGQDNATGWTLRHFVTVKGDPVPKGRPRLNRRGKPYTPEKTAQFEAAIGWATRKQPIDGPVRVEILAVFTRPQRLNRKSDPPGLLFYEGRADLDNVIKACNDGVQFRAFNNDRQAVDIHARARYSEKPSEPIHGPRTEIAIYSWDGPTNQPNNQGKTNHDTTDDMAPSAAGADHVSRP